MSDFVEVTVGSYWKEHNGPTIIKVIAPDAGAWWGMGDAVVFRTWMKDPDMDAEVYYMMSCDFRDAFRPTIWQEGKFV
jgi:hypothetical protein